MESVSDISTPLERKGTFIIHSYDTDEECDDIRDPDCVTDDVTTKKNATGAKRRKNKPPNLNIDRTLLRQDASDSPSPFGTSDLSDGSSPVSLVSLRKKAPKISDGRRSSPIVKRTSMLEKILDIPDVKAALVIDEGYELLRRRSYDIDAKPVNDRQPTPACNTNDKRFDFDPDIATELDLESISESDTSSLHSSQDAGLEGSAPGMRPHLDVLRDPKRISNPLDRIADSTAPSLVFGSPVKKDPISSPLLKKKLRKKSNSSGDEESPRPTPSTPKSRPLLSRLRFATLSRSGSNSSLEGWDSLARALARVGATSPLLAAFEFNESDLNPTLSPILKRKPSLNRWSAEESTFQVSGNNMEPGRPPTRKKTVSFSRLPSESNIKNAADCVYRLHEGHQFVKLRSNSRVYNRLYWFDQYDNCLRWEPSKKDAGKARIDISSIREIRPGKTTELFIASELSTHFPDECSFSVIHGEGKTLDLIANSADDANVWITGLRCLMSGQGIEELKMRSDARDLWLASTFDDADINGDGFLDQQESFRLLTNLSDGIRELRIKQKLQEYLQMKPDNKAQLSKEEFINIFKDVATRPEVYFLLARYATSDDRMSVDDLITFLESEQGLTDVTKEHCVEIINKHEPSEVLRSIPALGIDGFTKYLISESCTVFHPEHLNVCQDMSQPLTDYFIASSHNTYLMEDQVNGPSNVNAYVRALLRCCRCVELDCWDGPNDLPVVTHGYSNTNSVPFRNVIQSINDNAFRNSIYPVIISIENHCSQEQQLIMASDLKEVLGDQIYVTEFDEKAEQLPSPESLKYKFLIRGRKLPHDCTDDVGYVSEEDEGKEANDQLVTTPRDETSSRSSEERRQPLVRELSDLVATCVTVSMKEDMSQHHRTYNCQHTCSIHEKDALRLVELSSDEFISHCRRFVTRVYPSALRFDSSNFNPQDFWNCGVQIASLNYQTPGLMMDINDGKFSMNGGCGYVLKPEVMRDPFAYFSLLTRDPMPSVAPKILHIRVISGQNFPKPRGGGAKGQVIDPYVLIELFGVPCDCAEQRTRTAPNNSGGFPIFDIPFEFRLSLPALALVRFVVLDDDYIGDEFIGQFTIPFDCLQPGYRHLHLRSIFDEPLENATLFVHIAISDTDLTPSTPGSGTPNPTIISNKGVSGKRTAAQKLLGRKSRGRKEADTVQLFEVNQAELDESFGDATELLQLAAALRDAQRWSLASFRDACGVPSLSSVGQCVRSIAHRCRSDSSGFESSLPKSKKKMSIASDTDADSKLESRRSAASGDSSDTSLRRHPSDASQSSSSDVGSTGHVRLIRNKRKISLQLRGSSASSEAWRRTASSLDALVDDVIAVLDKTKSCCDQLSIIYDKVVKLSADLPKLVSNGTEPSESTSNSSKKFGKSKKKQPLTLDIDRKKARSQEDNLRWNCSVIKGHRDMLLSSFSDAEKILKDLWNAAIQYGLADLSPIHQQEDEVNGLNETDSANMNSNNNHPLSVNRKSRRSVPFVRSVSQLTKPKKSSAKLAKRSISTDALPVTLL